MGAGVEPGESAAEGLHFEFAITEKPLIDSSDLIFSSCGRLDIGCYIHYFIWIEIESYNGIVALWLCRLFFDREAVAFLIEFSHTISLWVVDLIAEDGCFLLFFCRTYSLFDHLGEARTMEDIIAKYKACRIVSDEILADGEGLCESIG